ncbi:MAG: hypothetical protein EA412_05500 [Chitinophagaceae bacterium]|nr:MAG: hypothetical protein EA412_05500 [Chitinophagaceae bacterium]
MAFFLPQKSLFATDRQENDQDFKNAVFIKIPTVSYFAFTYERSLLSKNIFNLNVETGLGGTFFRGVGPENINIPVNFNTLIGSTHFFELGISFRPKYVFLERFVEHYKTIHLPYNYFSLYDIGKTYVKNQFAIPVFLEAGYRYQSDNGFVLRVYLSPPIFEIMNNYPEAATYGNYRYQIDLKTEKGPHRVLYYTLPGIAVGKRF